MAEKFKWNSWDFDCDGDAYIIAKRECPDKGKVPDYIIKEDCLHSDCKDGMVVEEGICKYQVRTDWENCHGERIGGYYVELGVKDTNGKRGWFPVWIVRKGDWY